MSTTDASLARPDSAITAPRPARKGRLAEQVTRVLFVVPAAIAIVGLFGYPVVKNLLMSFQDYGLKTFFTGEAPFVGWRNYGIVVSENIFRKELSNTALFTVGSIAGQFVIGMLLALFFRKHFPLNGVLRALFLMPWLIPIIAGSAAWRAILELDNGILNVTLMQLRIISSPIGWLTSPNVALITVIMANIWLGIPFNLTLLYGGLQAIPEELYEAADIDGANAWKTFWYVTWPSLRPVVSVVLTLGVVYTLKVLDIILGLTQAGPANATQTIATRSYQWSFVEFGFGQGAALSNLLILISLVFALANLWLNRRRVDE